MNILPLILLFSVFAGAETAAQTLPDLIPYNDNNKWGYADTNGKVVIPARWQQVFFFDGDRAIVSLNDASNGNATYCTINRTGNYIITPSRNWTINWNTTNNWGSALNTTDSMGRLGLIDSNNNLLIPYEWEPYSWYQDYKRDSYKVVKKNGLVGMIDRSGKLVVPCSFGEINLMNTLFEMTQSVFVYDPDNMTGQNKMGVYSLAEHKLILPMRYTNIAPIRHKGKIIFRAVTAGNNNPANTNIASLCATAYFEYPSMKVVKDPGEQVQEPLPEKKIGNYIVKGHPGAQGVFTPAGKQLVATGLVFEIKGDTAWTRTTALRSDSFICTTTVYSLQQMHVLLKKTTITYQRPNELNYTRYICGNGARAHQEYLSHRASMPLVQCEGGSGPEFFKDSFMFTTEKTMDEELAFLHVNLPGEAPQAILATGYVRGSQNSNFYKAVVDGQGNYLLPPVCNADILGIDMADSIALVRLPGVSNYLLLMKNGRELARVKNGPSDRAFFSQGKLYLRTVVNDKKKITDTGGRPQGLWVRYNMDVRSRIPERFNDDDRYFCATDSTGLLHILNAEGAEKLPELAGRYKFIKVVTNNMLEVTDSANKRHLVTRTGKDLLPGFTTGEIRPCDIGKSPAARVYTKGGRLFLVWAIDDAAKKQYQLYIDDRNRLHTSLWK
jgi:hypothetical protein